MLTRRQQIEINTFLESTELDYHLLHFITMKFLSDKQEKTDNLNEFIQKYGFEFRDYELFSNIVKKYDAEDESCVTDIKSSLNALRNSKIQEIREIYSDIPEDVLDKDTLIDIIKVLKKDYPIFEFFEKTKNFTIEVNTYPIQVSIFELMLKLVEERDINSFYDPVGNIFLLPVIDFKNATIYTKSKALYYYTLEKMILTDIPFSKIKLENREVLVDVNKEKYDTFVSMPPVYDRKLQRQAINQVKQYHDYKSNNLLSVYLLNLIDHLSDDGILITMITPDLLVRKDAYSLRKLLVDNNMIDCIIDYKQYLPVLDLNLIIIRKDKKTDDILFIKENDSMFTASADKILECYNNRETITKFSQTVSKEEIIQNNYNLHPKRYVYLLEYETRNLNDIMKKQEEYKTKIIRMDEEIENLVNQIKEL